jgi:hypothetical protein
MIFCTSLAWPFVTPEKRGKKRKPKPQIHSKEAGNIISGEALKSQYHYFSQEITLIRHYFSQELFLSIASLRARNFEAINEISSSKFNWQLA